MAKNTIPKQLYEWFIQPLLDIPLDDPKKNETFKSLLQSRTSEDFDKNLKIIKENLNYLLEPKTKKELLEYLYEVSPSDDHHYITWFKRLIGMVCNQINDTIKDDDAARLNDIAAEFWAGHFEEYSIKMYFQGSIQRLREETKYILEEITLDTFGSNQEGGLGSEYHLISKNEAIINEEVSIHIFFIQTKRRILFKSNIYILFWSKDNRIQLWEDVSQKTIETICIFLDKFLPYRGLDVINVNISEHKVQSNLPKRIVEMIDMVGKIKSPLKYERIVERSVNFSENRYNDIVREINTSYIHYCFAGMYVLVRKLLENLVIDSLRLFYGTRDIDKYFDSTKSKLLGFGILRENFQEMINNPEFIQKVNTVDQKMIDWLLIFKVTGDIHAHSMFSIAHQDLIERNKINLNILLSFLEQIITKLKL